MRIILACKLDSESIRNWLASDAERAANWRPAGWHGTAGHNSGLLWVGMTPDGYDGSHKDPAPEVWLFDAKKRKRLGQFELKSAAISISVENDRKRTGFG